MFTSDKDLNKAFEFQQKNTSWTFYEERAFIENLFSQRFNYLLLVYSLFVTAFATIIGKENKLIIIALGFVVTFLISMTVYRAYIKLIILLKILYRLPKNHVFPITAKETIYLRRKALFNVNPVIGIIIPTFFELTFIVAFIIIINDWWVIK